VFPEQDLDSYTAYGQLRYRLTDELRLSAGIRYTRDEKTYFEDVPVGAGALPIAAPVLPVLAVRAGLGITVLPRDMVPPGLRLIDGPPLPSLDDTEIAMLSARGFSMPAQLFRDHIGRSLEQAGT
jgi:DNA-binding transcriptional LysR family regulator